MINAIRPVERKHLLCLVGAALVLALAGCGGRGAAAREPAPAAVEPVPASVREAARGVVEQYRQAYAVRSIDALLPLYVRSPDLVLVRQGRPLAGWEAVQGYLTTLIKRAKEIQIAIENVRILPLGDSGAVVTARVTRTVHDGTTSVREEGQLTMALRKEGERWVIASEHFSYPPKL